MWAYHDEVAEILGGVAATVNEMRKDGRQPKVIVLPAHKIDVLRGLTVTEGGFTSVSKEPVDRMFGVPVVSAEEAIVL